MTSSIDARRDRAQQIDAWLKRQGAESFELHELASGCGMQRHRAAQLLTALVRAGRLVRIQPGIYVAVAHV